MSELQLNPKYKEILSTLVNRSPYFSLLSMEIKDLEWGTAVLEVELEEKHLQPFGYVHGGVIASVMDAAAFWAVSPQVKDGMRLTTVEIKVNYLSPVQKGKLVAKGRCIKIGKTLALGEALHQQCRRKSFSPWDSDDDDRPWPESRRTREPVTQADITQVAEKPLFVTLNLFQGL